MRLALQLGYEDPLGSVALAQEADRLGFHSVWTSEAYGTDAVTPMAWIAATTERVKVGSAIMQMPARSPAATATTVARSRCRSLAPTTCATRSPRSR